MPAGFFSPEGRGRLSLPLPQHNGFPFQREKKKTKQKELQLFQPVSLSLPKQHKQGPCDCCKAAGTAMGVQPRLQSSQRICQMQTSSDPKFPSLPCSSRRSLRLEPLPAWHNPGSNCFFHAPFEGVWLWPEQLPRHRPLAGQDMDLCCVLGCFLLLWAASSLKAKSKEDLSLVFTLIKWEEVFAGRGMKYFPL